MDERKKNLYQGLLTVLGSFLLHLSLGHFYTVSNMAPYILSYIAAKVDKTITVEKAVWLSALGLGFQGIAMPLGGVLSKKFGPRAAMMATVLFAGGSVLLTYFSVKKTFIGVVITIGTIFGFGMGIGYSVAIACAASWFPERRGLVVGLIVGGFGLGSLVFTPIQTKFINPSNKKVDEESRYFTDDELLERVPTAFLLMGSILAALELIAFALVRMKPAPAANQPSESQARSQETSTAQSTENKPKEFNVEPRKLLRHVDYYLLFTMMILNILPTSILTSSLKIPICFQQAMWSTFFFTLPLISNTKGNVLKTLYAIWAFGLFFFLSGVFSMMPAATGAILGPANLAVNYGMVYLGFAFGSLISLAITYQWRPSPTQNFLLSGTTCLITLSLALWLEDRKLPKRFSFMKWFSSHCAAYRVAAADA
uniref:MFS domain-containing protein n=1 Tax=Trichobilharzia regenti TaxID=157069 RepID=A0AA85J3T4_TRIRE|nr:unnamed protein product [Trichobilharzia regenti]